MSSIGLLGKLLAPTFPIEIELTIDTLQRLSLGGFVISMVNVVPIIGLYFFYLYLNRFILINSTQLNSSQTTTAKKSYQ